MGTGVESQDCQQPYPACAVVAISAPAGVFMRWGLQALKDDDRDCDERPPEPYPHESVA